jgi:hypothetical protein
MRTPLVALAVVLTSAVLLGAFADVVIFKDGTYEDGTIKSATAESITIGTPYGDVSYPRNTFYVFYQVDASRPGQHYYEGGLAMLQLHKKFTAKELFDKAIAIDQRYGPPSEKVLQAYEPQPGASTTQQETNVRTIRLQCALCGGTGKVEGTFGIRSSSTDAVPGWFLASHSVGGSPGGSSGSSGSSSGGVESHIGTTSVMMNCPACSGKGYRILHLRPDEGICPTCGGAGSVKGDTSSSGTSGSSVTFGTHETGSSGSSSSSSSSGSSSGATSLSAVQYPPCKDCGGRGIRPLAMGGTLEGLQEVGGGANPGGSGIQPGGGPGPGGGEEMAGDEEQTAKAPVEEEPGFFAKYKTYLLLGLAAVLVIGFFVAKSGKK